MITCLGLDVGGGAAVRRDHHRAAEHVGAHEDRALRRQRLRRLEREVAHPKGVLHLLHHLEGNAKLDAAGRYQRHPRLLPREPAVNSPGASPFKLNKK